MSNLQTVFIVYNDDGLRQSLTTLVRSVGMDCEFFASDMAFLDVYDPLQAGCLLLDISLSDMNGLELLERINVPEVNLPAIVISAQSDAPTVVRAMRAGAFNFFETPCHDQILLAAIQECLTWDLENRRRIIKIEKLRRRLEHLTSGEYNVLEQIMDGKSNKAIAADLGVSVRTVEVRRAKFMKKMRAGSLAELIRMIVAAQTGIVTSEPVFGSWTKKDSVVGPQCPVLFASD